MPKLPPYRDRDEPLYRQYINSKGINIGMGGRMIMSPDITPTRVKALSIAKVYISAQYIDGVGYREDPYKPVLFTVYRIGGEVEDVIYIYNGDEYEKTNNGTRFKKRSYNLYTIVDNINYKTNNQDRKIKEIVEADLGILHNKYVDKLQQEVEQTKLEIEKQKSDLERYKITEIKRLQTTIELKKVEEAVVVKQEKEWWEIYNERLELRAIRKEKYSWPIIWIRIQFWLRFIKYLLIR
jgi:hypothetical protein